MLVGLLAAMATPATGADWQAWERYMESGQRALEQGREVGAENWLQDAVQEAERQDARSPQLVRSLKRLLELYRRQEAARRRGDRAAPRRGLRLRPRRRPR